MFVTNRSIDENNDFNLKNFKMIFVDYYFVMYFDFSNASCEIHVMMSSMNVDKSKWFEKRFFNNCYQNVISLSKRVVFWFKNDMICKRKRLRFEMISNHVENKKSKEIELKSENRSKRKNVEYVKKKHRRENVSLLIDIKFTIELCKLFKRCKSTF